MSVKRPSGKIKKRIYHIYIHTYIYKNYPINLIDSSPLFTDNSLASIILFTSVYFYLIGITILLA